MDKESAVYDYPGCPQPFGVNRDHKEIAKFQQGDDHALNPAIHFLMRVASNAIALRDARSRPAKAPPAPVNGEEDTFSLLADYDTVFLIDDSPSMQGEKWDLVRKILDYSTVVATRYDPDGIDVHFMNNVNASKDNVRDCQNLGSQL